MNIAAESKLLISFHSASQLCPEGKRELFYTHTLLHSQKIVTAHSLASVTAIDRENPWGQALE